MASIALKAWPDEPLIVVLGATGTGKSQLAVELAKRFNGEIINGDAMQLYKGLPVITNKMTASEQQGIPHHLLGTIDLDEPTWVVSTFVKKATSVMAEIRARGRLPILVGGTHYYTQSLLFHDTLTQDDDTLDKDDRPLEEQFPLLGQPTDVLLSQLRKVDPVMASHWHPNDRRKIQTSLRIYLQTGQRASDVYAKQHSRKNQDVPAMRFPQTLLFWVHAEPEALRARLDRRVDGMLDSGLLDEVDQLHDRLRRKTVSGHAIDESRGIWVSIGFKEFRAYDEALRSGSDADTIAKAKSEAVERTKISTRQYAKGQVRWIRIKLVNALREAKANNSLFLLDGTDLEAFGASVVQPAADITTRFLAGDGLPEPQALSGLAKLMLNADDKDRIVDRSVKHCEVCNVTCTTEEQWDSHTRSKTHRKLSARVVRTTAALVEDQPDLVQR